MKELIVVSKTHLDLGFTDTAENVKKKYLTEFIPAAIDTAETLNRDGEKRFVWTTGSWILKEALRSDDENLRKRLSEAIKRGDIAPHALPFTTHTELMDKDLFRYGLSLVDEIDAIAGKKTIAAKMTDVPGHTAAMIPLLAEKGIKLLHVGVNGASAMPDVPECFLWKFKNSEIVVVYSGDYGGVFKSEVTDDILYFDHTLDNRGAGNANAIAQKFLKLKKEFPDYRVRAGRMDDVAETLWQNRKKLPVVEAEIGDTWIHGVATDPYKTAAMKRLCKLKTKWLQEGLLQRGSEEYRNMCDALLCVAEHTWGMDTKTNFGDYEHYATEEFQAARQKDVVTYKNPFVYFPISFVNYFLKLFGIKRPSYSKLEYSWKEQRNYIDQAVEAVEPTRAKEARAALDALKPKRFELGNGKAYRFGKTLTVGKNAISVNAKGGVTLSIDGNPVLDAKDLPLIEYRTYDSEDFQYWLTHYTRNYKKTKGWAIGDFARPGYKRYDGTYWTGKFEYTVSEAIEDTGGECAEIRVKLSCDSDLTEQLGAPDEAFASYRLTDKGLSLRFLWLEKKAVRITESVALRLYPNTDNVFEYEKLGERVDLSKTVNFGGRKLAAVEKTYFQVDSEEYFAECIEAPLIATDGGNLLRFDNEIGTPKNGLTYVLYDNVWGTNFPLWYDESAEFNVKVELERK